MNKKVSGPKEGQGRTQTYVFVHSLRTGDTKIKKTQLLTASCSPPSSLGTKRCAGVEGQKYTEATGEWKGGAELIWWEWGVKERV